MPGKLDPNEDNTDVLHCLPGNNIWVVIGLTAGHAGTWSSDSQITCRLVSADLASLNGGAGGGLPVQVQVSSQPGNMSRAFSFDTASPQSIAAQNIMNSNVEVLNISGLNFANSAYSPTFRLGSTAAEGTFWNSDSSINSISPLGTRSSLLTIVSVQACGYCEAVFGIVSQVGTLTMAVSYDQPKLSYQQQFNLPPRSSALLLNISSFNSSNSSNPNKLLNSTKNCGNSSNCSTRVPNSFLNVTQWYGSDFGQYDLTAGMDIMDTKCEATVWRSDSSVGCKNALNSFATRLIAMTTGERKATMSKVVTYDNGILLGPQPYASNTVTNKSCNQTFMQASGLSNQSSKGCVFPAINTSAGNSTTPFNTPSTGSAMISLFGKGFSVSDYSQKARHCVSSPERSAWSSDSGLYLKITASISSTNLAMATFGVRVSSVSELLSVDLALLSAFRAGNGPVSGGVSITANGKGFSTADYSMASRIGGCMAPFCEHSYTPSTQDPTTAWRSESSLLVRYLGGVQDRMSFVCTQAQISNTETLAFSYDGWPSVLALSPPNTPPLSYDNDRSKSSIEILGMNLGTVATTVKASVGRTGCRSTAWVSSSTLTCYVASGVDFESAGNWYDSDGQPLFKQSGPVNVVVFHCKGLDECHYYFRTSSNTLSAGFTYDSPSISSVSRATASRKESANAAGSTQQQPMLASGSSFAAYSFSAQSRISQTSSVATLWVADSSIYGMIPCGQGHTSSLEITLNMKYSTLSEALTYDSSTLSSTVASNMQTSSLGGPILIRGNEFGNSDFSTGSHLGSSSCEASLWTSSTAMMCKKPAGQRPSLSLVISSSDNSGSRSSLFSIDHTVISNLCVQNSPSTGSVSVSVIGTGISSSDYSVGWRSVGTAGESTSWISETCTAARTPGAVNTYFRNSLTAGVLMGTASQYFTIDNPSPFRLEPSNAGQSFIKAKNLTYVFKASASLFNLGSNDASSRARVGSTACESSMWQSDSSITGKISLNGIGFSCGIVLTGYSHSLSSQTELFSFIVQSLSSEVKANVPTSGTAAFMFGQNFGNTQVSFTSRTGETSSEASVWLSKSSLSCKMSRGIKATRPLFLTLLSKDASQSEIFSYSPLTVSSARDSNGVSTGSVSVTLSGQSAGTISYSFGGRVGRSAAEASIWISDSSISSLFASGISYLLGPYREYGGSPLPSLLSSAQSVIVCTSGRSTGSISEGFTYRLQISVSAVQSPNFPVGFSSKRQVVILGLGFGTLDWTDKTRLKQSAAEGSFWVSDTAIQALVADGLWNYLGAGVTIGILKGTLSKAFSFDGNWPYLTSINASSTQQPSLWKDTSFLIGTGFGSTSCSPKARTGGSACSSTLWLSWSSVKCMVIAGSGSYLPSVITVGVCNSTDTVAKDYISSLTNSFSYDDPAVSSFLPYNRLGTTQIMTVFGQNFGRSDGTMSFRIGSSQCEATRWGSSSSLKCSVASGFRGTLDVALTVAKLLVESWVDQDNNRYFDVNFFMSVFTTAKAFSFDIPSISPSLGNSSDVKWNISDDFLTNPMYPFNLPTTMLTTSTVIGKGFSAFDVSPRLSAGRTAGQFTEWTSSSAVHTAVGVGGFGPSGSRGLTVTLGLRDGSTSAIWSFDYPALDAVFAFPGPATTAKGNFIQQTMNIFGSRFMPSNPSALARVQLTRCQRSTWVSDTSTTCLLPRGIAGYDIFSLTSGERVGTWTPTAETSYTYYRILLQIQSSGGQIVPGTSLTVFGVGFGINDYTTRLRLGQTACEVSTWTSDTTTTCLVPAGALRPDRVTSTVAGLENFWVPIYVSK